MNIERLKAMIEAEALRRQASREGFTLEAVTSWLGAGLPPPPGFRAPSGPAPQPLTYRYLADLHGSEFVRACYTHFLGRAADPAGLDSYHAMLLRGEEKAFIAGRIRYSTEGRGRAVAVEGLLPRYLVAAAKKVPVAGAAFSWLEGLATLHRRQRHARAFEQAVISQLDALAAYTARSGEAVAMRVEALRSVLESRD